MESTNEVEGGLDSEFWQACGGGTVQLPPLNSEVYYFPQGHAEHACEKVEFKNILEIPAYTACRVSSIKYLADDDTDEVYAKIGLVPISNDDCSVEEEEVTSGVNCCGREQKPNFHAKILTQSDANNGGGFSVPCYCAENLFPPLDYNADPPVQTLIAKDVHGKAWKFRHIYRGMPRRHLLTTGWSSFVNNKQLVAGDSILFFRDVNGELFVGIRRARRGLGGSGNGKFSRVSGENVDKVVGICYGGNGRVTSESVVEAAMCAATGQAFEVVYYPRASSQDFVVRASLVNRALCVCWRAGLRFKMALAAAGCSKMCWFWGTIVCVKFADSQWLDSPWKLLQVSWEEPDNETQNVKRVSPWEVELVLNLPIIDVSSSFPQRKRMRLLGDSTHAYGNSSSSSGTLVPITAAGMQVARHTAFVAPTSSSLVSSIYNSKENGRCSRNSSEKEEDGGDRRIKQFKLFGQLITTEEQIVTTSNDSNETESQETQNPPSTAAGLDLLESYDGIDESLKHMFHKPSL